MIWYFFLFIADYTDTQGSWDVPEIEVEQLAAKVPEPEQPRKGTTDDDERQDHE